MKRPSTRISSFSVRLGACHHTHWVGLAGDGMDGAFYGVTKVIEIDQKVVEVGVVLGD